MEFVLNARGTDMRVKGTNCIFGVMTLSVDLVPNYDLKYLPYGPSFQPTIISRQLLHISAGTASYCPGLGPQGPWKGCSAILIAILNPFFIITLHFSPIFMDTTPDEDLKLQRASADLIADFQRFLPRFLFNTIPAPSAPPSAANAALRPLVRETKTDQLIKLVGPTHDRLSVPSANSIASPSWNPFKNGRNCLILI